MIMVEYQMCQYDAVAKNTIQMVPYVHV